jgi:hypothetical protein
MPEVNVSDAASPRPAVLDSIAHLEHAASHLDRYSGAPPRYKRAGQRRFEEIDRSGVVEHSAGSPGRHRPAVGSTILVEPSRHSGISLAETAGRAPSRY